MKKECRNCVHFISWREFCGDNDPMEPNDEGFCDVRKGEDGDRLDIILGDNPKPCEMFDGGNEK